MKTPTFRPPSTWLACLAWTWLGLAASLAAAPAGAADDEVTPRIRAVRAHEPPTLDGDFRDACWLDAPLATGFVESGPESGAPPAFPTELRVAVDADALYLAFRARTGDPDQLVTTVMQRDGNILGSDDYFIFALDTFHDRRDAYYFMVNAAGVQADGRLIDEGVTVDGNWDGTWQAATRLHDDGWAAEIAIPLRDLRFRETEDGTWGFVALVSSRARQRYVSWPDLRASGTRVSRYGSLTGLTELDGRQHLVLLPYLTNGSRLPHTDLDDESLRRIPGTWERALGLDVQAQPTQSTSLSLALNPDFATIEADQFVFNLTVDELFLPERRPFFVEGTDLFSTPARLLYTRRIGADGGIIAAGKLLGRHGGATAYGVLSATTGEGFEAGHQFTAARIKRGILGSSSIGAMVVSKDRLRGGLAALNRAAGVDLNWQISPTLRLVATHSRSQRSGPGGDGHETTVDASYNGNLFGPRHRLFVRGTAQDVSAGFDIDDVGFMPGSRVGQRGATGRVRYAYQPSGILREIAVMPIAWRYTDPEAGRRPQAGAHIELSVRTAGRLRPRLLLERSSQLDPDDGTRYRNSQRTLAVAFGPYPRVGGELSWREGRNFGDRIRYLEARLTTKAADAVSLTGSAFYLRREPEDGTAEEDVIAVAACDWRASPKLYLRLMLQGDTGSNRGLVSALLRYDLAPGSALYLSFRESRRDVRERLVTEERVLLGKLSFRISG